MQLSTSKTDLGELLKMFGTLMLINLGMLISIMSARQGQTIDIEMVLNDGKMGINCLNDLLGVKK